VDGGIDYCRITSNVQYAPATIDQEQLGLLEIARIEALNKMYRERVKNAVDNAGSARKPRLRKKPKH
jgi:hypothetical protein